MPARLYLAYTGEGRRKVALHPYGAEGRRVISIEMSEGDFDRLCETSEQWRGADWQGQAERFQHCERKYDAPPSWGWRYAYWLDGQWATVILARSFLRETGYRCEIVFDRAGEDGPAYVILTDYASPLWRSKG